MIPVLCALASAIGFILALGTPDVSLLAWVAPAPILWLAYGDVPARRVVIAAVSAYFVGQLGMFWPYLGAMGPVIVAAAALPAVVFTGAVLAARLASRRLPPTVGAMVFPALWTGWEVLSAALSPHGTIGAWAYSQVAYPVVIQSASLAGLWIVSFLIALFASCVASSIRHRTMRPVVLACVLLLANVAFGTWTLTRADGHTVRVAASARDHDDGASPEQVALAQAAEVRRLAAEGVKTVVFDEKAALLPTDRRTSALAPLLEASRETGTSVVSGFDQTTPERRNVALAISPDGRLRQYTKRHHIPGLEREFIIGTDAGLLGGGAAMAICKDFDFQATLRHDALAGARDGGLRLMLAPAWDFGADGWLHARMAILRGVEGGYAIVRAASNGLVTVSDAQGRVRALHASGTTHYASAVADLPLGPGPTLYLRIGDLFGWMAGAVGILLVAWSLRAAPVGVRVATLTPDSDPNAVA